MKVIFSYWQSNNHFFCDIEIAKTANLLAQKQGYKTCLYTDEIGYLLLKNSVPYDEIKLFDKDLLSNFNTSIWSLGKILAMRETNEPFIHLDFDLFLFNSIEKYIQSDFFSLNFEPWVSSLNFFKNSVKEIYYLFPDKNQLNINSYDSYNFAIAGGYNYNKINLVCDQIINLAINNQEELKQFDKDFNKSRWVLPLIFEQVLIPNLLLKQFDIKTKTIFDIPDSLKWQESFNNNDKQKFAKECAAFLKQNFIEKKIIHLHGYKNKKREILSKIY